jgi:hypothetical protein
VIAKPLVNGLNAFYFNIPTRRRKNGCPVPNEALGQNYIIACGEDGTGGRASGSNITRQGRSFCIRSKKNCRMAA